MKVSLFVLQFVAGQDWSHYRLPDDLNPVHYDIDLKVARLLEEDLLSSGGNVMNPISVPEVHSMLQHAHIIDKSNDIATLLSHKVSLGPWRRSVRLGPPCTPK